jgi:hypothetical protein
LDWGIGFGFPANRTKSRNPMRRALTEKPPVPKSKQKLQKGPKADVTGDELKNTHEARAADQ